MFAQGQVMLAQSRSVPVIPASALFEEAGQTYAFAVVNGKLSKRAVKVGLRDDTSGMVEAVDGLKTGEAVVRVRMNGLKDDAPAVLLPNAAKTS
jgi:multidrug efflux pump subunit AcrA (membrane-fusion protein)